jgi:subtilisin-like proprotein convertase family protein
MKKLYLNLSLLQLIVLIFLPSKLKSQNYWASDLSQIKEIDNTPVKIFDLNDVKFKNEFKNQKQKVVFLPNENNDYESFIIKEILLLSPQLSLKYPLIQTFKGFSQKRPNVSLRMTLTPRGVSAWINIPGKENVFIQPDRKLKGKHYTYKRSEKHNKDWECKTISDFNSKSGFKKNVSFNKSINNDKKLRTFRLAISTTAEYTNFWDDNDDENGTGQEDALASIVSTMNRVNSVYETDLSITMQLVSGVELIYTDPETDPYTGNYNSEVQEELTSNFGEENYDIGHLFAYGSNNGNAGCIGCICKNGVKGSAFTSHGFSSNDGEFLTDYFDIDYVAHEMGHQFGAFHTFAYNNEGSGSNVEPGSGSTIMGYAGITGPDDIQQHSDPYFNYKSIENIANYIATESCFSSVELTNNPPNADAGINYIIPKGTAYELSASASDIDNDQLTYCWEQIDSASMTFSEFGPDSYTGATARSLPPSMSQLRSIPNLTSVLNGELTQTNPPTGSAWETVSNVARELNWGLTVRDRSPLSTGQGGQSSTDSMTLSITTNAGPFSVTSQSEDENIWKTGDNVIIQWDVANTNLQPINTLEVSILLSLDAGQSFNTLISNSTPNDGEFIYRVPSGLSSENARIKISSKNSIYYSINKKPISIVQRPFAVLFDKFSYDFCSPLSETILLDLGVYESLNNPISLSITDLNSGLSYTFSQDLFSSSTSSISINLTGLSSLPIGVNRINILAESGNVSAIFPIEINNYQELISRPELISPSQGNQEVLDFQFEWNTNPNVSKYIFEISLDSDLSSITNQINTENNFINLQELDSGTTYYWRVASENECGISEWSDIFSFVTAKITNNSYVASSLPLVLNDAEVINNQSVNIGYTSSSIFISDVNTISDIEVLVNINHTWVSDLSLFLVSPDGTIFSLAENIGLGTQSGSGDNFTNTIFYQNASISINNARPPFTGKFRPNQPIDGLIGKTAFGNWTLNIEDNGPEDIGELLDFQINMTIKGEILANSDLDSIADIIDNCPQITNQNQSDSDLDGEGDICDFDEQNNFQILKFDESCITRNNGSISISAFADFNYTYILLGPNGYNEEGSFFKQTGKIINNLQNGDYMLCIYSNGENQIERCFTAAINEPEPLSVSTIVNYTNQELNLNLNGGDNYYVELNGRYYNYNISNNISLPLIKGINQLKITTDLGCQGTYERTINISENAYVSPNPVASIAKVYIGGFDKIFSIKFYSIDGEFIKSNQINLQNDENYFEWSMSEYPPGAYIMNIISKTGGQSIKIIKR